MIASAAVRKAIEYEYEYRCTEYAYEEIRSASARCTNERIAPSPASYFQLLVFGNVDGSSANCRGARHEEFVERLSEPV
jgi:hypothetical protein